MAHVACRPRGSVHGRIHASPQRTPAPLRAGPHTTLDLLASGGRLLVQDVAATWGFYHFGRFAEQYRRKFGVLPSDTARAGRAT